MCRVLGVKRPSFHAWERRQPSQREVADQALAARIRAIHREHAGRYGVRRVVAQLRREGFLIGPKRVRRLMRQLGLRGLQPRLRMVTTRRGHRPHGIPDLVQRDFDANRPNALWVADMTYLHTLQGTLYLAILLDACTRQVVGWAMSTAQTVELMMQALGRAAAKHRPRGTIHHSDQGSQYASRAYQTMCHRLGMRMSMGSVGDCYDNAMAESWFATLKREGLPHDEILSRRETKRQVIDFIEGYYNTRRAHSALAHETPNNFAKNA